MKNDALEITFKKYYNELKLYVYSLCRDVALAEDLASDAFFKAISSVDEEKQGFKYWLFKVARNRYIDYVRKNSRQTAIDDNLSDGGNLVESIIEKEEYRALYHAISLLKDSHREVVQLYYFDGLSVAEISDITGESIENVKVMLYRSRNKLKSLLEEQNEF